MTSPQWTNWAGNQRAVAQRVAEAGSAEQVAELVGRVRESGGTLKAVGSGHSFTGAARTDGVRLTPASGRYTVDREAKRVTVPAGMPLHELNRVLAAVDLALPNLGDIDRQTIAGAISTGTHGTGSKLGGLATFVAGLTLVTGAGEVLHASPTENADVFEAARLGVGAVGVLTELELSCVDSFPLRADERPMPLDTVLSTVDELAAANDHFEFYWFPYTELT
jgi:L-gulonolactone oxidase